MRFLTKVREFNLAISQIILPAEIEEKEIQDSSGKTCR
jgi:hypothetical protein